MKNRLWRCAALIAALFLLASCGGGGGGSSPLVPNTPDTTPPSVSSTTPADSAVNVAVNAVITASFSEAVDPGTVSVTTFTVSSGVTGTVSYDAVNHIATFTPSSNLSYNTMYSATVTTGVKDLAGNAMTADHTWSFTTGPTPDTTPPSVASTSPGSGAGNVDINAAITANFSEALAGSTVTISTFLLTGPGNTPVSGNVSYSGITATFTPSASLASSSTYTATITTGVKDLAANALVSNYTWTFATAAAPGLSNAWTWISGTAVSDATGTYGTKGTADALNVPGGRYYSTASKDGNGNRWLFGGRGHAGTVASGLLNDLWKFDGTSWTWVSGANTLNQIGVYGSAGIAAATNVPGAREHAVSWTDVNGNFWLLGGMGFDSNGVNSFLNDLWKFDGTNWTWMRGSNTNSAPGAYGTKGTPAAPNFPGAREGAVVWTDGNGNVWLFGGTGYDSNASQGLLNDLWKFDGTNWTWVSGAKTIGLNGTYGTKGTAAPSNSPGARFGAAGAIDSQGNLWLFGGSGPDVNGTLGSLCDLWKFDGTNWTWVSGANTYAVWGVYGTQGMASGSNKPGCRQFANLWIDSNDNLWLFGGDGLASAGAGSLSDLWKFDGTNWTWIKGSNSSDAVGVYGTKGTAAAGTMPGGRLGAVIWSDGANGFSLFGGAYGVLNDLWQFHQ